MNTRTALMVPEAPVEIVAEVTTSLEQRHQRMIRNGADLQDALLEDLTTEGLNAISGLIDQIGVDLAYCRTTNLEGRQK